MKLEIGKLYSCEEYFLMLYPDKGTATDTPAADDAAHASALAAHWTRRLGKPVSSLPNNTPILVLNVEKSIPLVVLNVEENFYEVLAGDKKGWIIIKDWLKIKEIV